MRRALSPTAALGALRAVLFRALPVCPPPIVPRDDHPADCPTGPRTLGFPPRGRQGLRATSRHFPGKSVLGRAWEQGSSVGWQRAAFRGESGRLEPGGDRSGAHQGALSVERSVLFATPSPPPRSGQAGSVRAAPRPTTVFLLRPGSVALRGTQTLFVPECGDSELCRPRARCELARPAL